MSVVSGPAPAERPSAPVVPGYALQRLLGRGGSGEVWRAVPRGGGSPVAVKVLVDGDPEHQAREAALLARLDHPHLVRLHEVVHQPRRGEGVRVALVLDLLEGGSLAALLARRGRLRPGEVVTAIAPVAAALAAAHERGIVHGDLSPGNIVFTAEGRPVLTDLGVARMLGEQAAGGVTPAYVDPVVARGGAPGPASDVFGVAAAAFHALTGVPPWNAATPADAVRVAAEAELPDLAELAPDTPPALVAVLRRGLAADPHQRGTAAALALDLRAACRPEPVRLPVGGVGDDELGRTGSGSRTELTHQVPGRRPGAGGLPARIARPRLAGARARASRAVQSIRGHARALAGRALRPIALLSACALLVCGVLWVSSAWGERTSPGTEANRGPGEGGEAGGRPTFSAPVEPAAVPGAPAPGTPEEWAAVVQALYRQRAEAFTRGSPALLGQVYAPGSAQLAADRAAVDALRSAGQVLRGFGPSGVRVDEAATSSRRAELHLVDGWSGYEVVRRLDPAGPALAAGAGRGATPVRMVLRLTDGGWRIESVERGP